MSNLASDGPFHETDRQLIEAVLCRDAAAARRALAVGADASLAPNGIPLLTIAAIHGELEIVRELLAHGAEPDRRDMHGETALGYLARISSGERHLKVMELLVEAGANPNLASVGQDVVPLEGAATFLNRQAGRKLMELGANIPGTRVKNERYRIFDGSGRTR